MITYDRIKAANETIKPIQIERKDKKTGKVTVKDYAEVNQKVKAFRMVFPDGFIISDMVSNENGICIFKATCGYYDESGNAKTLGVGTAYEKENSSFINATSYIENCETSAVGRCLSMAGFGNDTPISGAEEVQNAMVNQCVNAQNEIKKEEKTASAAQVKILSARYTGANLDKLLAANNITRLEDLPMQKASELISKLTKKGENNGQ